VPACDPQWPWSPFSLPRAELCELWAQDLQANPETRPEAGFNAMAPMTLYDDRIPNPSQPAPAGPTRTELFCP